MRRPSGEASCYVREALSDESAVRIGVESHPLFDDDLLSTCCRKVLSSESDDPWPTLSSSGSSDQRDVVVTSKGLSSRGVASMGVATHRIGGNQQVLTKPQGIGKASMVSSCDPAFCRSVLVHQALRRLGLHFASNQGSDFEYSMSKQTSDIHDFISHDWGTGRWSKLCSMLLVYNGRLATFVGNLAAISVCVLETDAVGLLPREMPFHGAWLGRFKVDITVAHWCMSIAGPIFLLCFFFGHNLTSFFSVEACHRRVFVDKLCICQTNVDMKTKGIHALAGILKQSRRLVILWTPRYLKRLWCVYELTSWVHHQAKHHQPRAIRFEPVGWARIMLGTWLLSFLYGVVWLIPNTRTKAWLELITLVPTACIVHGFMQVAQDLVLIPDQLDNFQVEASECFCCAVGHTHPETGISIPCDRELIYGTLTTWAKLQRHSHITPFDQSMQHFDSQVKGSLKQWAKKAIGLAPLPYDYALLGSAPCFWCYADFWAGFLSTKAPTEDYLRQLLRDATSAFLFFPVMLKLVSLLIFTFARRCTVNACSCICNILMIVTSMGFALIVYVSWHTPMGILARLGNFVPQMLATCAWILVTVVTFNMDRLRCRLVQKFQPTCSV